MPKSNHPFKNALSRLISSEPVTAAANGSAPPVFSAELCIVIASLFFTVFSNQQFWSTWADGRDWGLARNWLLAMALGVLLTALHSLLLGFVVNRWTGKPLLGILFLLTALATFYMQRYTVYFDVDMMRNIFHTDMKEARELLSASMLIWLGFFGLVPAVVLLRLRLRQQPLRKAVTVRAVFMLGAVGAGLLSILVSYQDLSAQLRNQKELRYLITPANMIVSSIRLATTEREEAQIARIAVGVDAVGPPVTPGIKPRLLVVVVGETVRAANWGLNGYTRQTTPQLATQDVINFQKVTSCGTNTEVSLPCMFSAYGRRAYDEKEIRRSESVLHVLDRAGVKTVWRDNQSGCKGVCENLEMQRPGKGPGVRFCNGDDCYDEVLLNGFEDLLNDNRRDLVVVLHQLGNHGPAYSKRYPAAFRQFKPTCEQADLGNCSREEIVNSYDNALLYTDNFLNQIIQRLKAQSTHSPAMLYVSDHGESLGENNIYLHGFPYAIAPREQIEVPMAMWLSNNFAASASLDVDCLKERATQAASHDNLFHSLLGLMSVTTSVYDRAFDLTGTCRR